MSKKTLTDALGNSIEPITTADAVNMNGTDFDTVADALEEMSMDSGTINFYPNLVQKEYTSGKKETIRFSGKTITQTYINADNQAFKSKVTEIKDDGSIEIHMEYPR